MLKENNEYVEVFLLDQNDERQNTGKIAKRGKLVGEGFYVIGVNNWIINSKGEILVQKMSRLKSNNPLKWSSTNGLREIGENSVDAVIRESSEELGIEIDKDKVKFVDSRIAGDSLIVDIFFTLMDVKIEDIKIQEEEVEEIRFVSPEDLVLMDLSTTCEYIKDNIAKYLDIVLKQYAQFYNISLSIFDWIYDQNYLRFCFLCIFLIKTVYAYIIF